MLVHLFFYVSHITNAVQSFLALHLGGEVVTIH